MSTRVERAVHTFPAWEKHVFDVPEKGKKVGEEVEWVEWGERDGECERRDKK